MDYLKYDWCSYGSIAAMLREDKYAALLPADKIERTDSPCAPENAVLDCAVVTAATRPDLPQTDAMKAVEAKYRRY